MKLKKTITILITSLTLILFTGIAYATNYYINEDDAIEAYGYGADWSSTLTAVVDSNGYYSNITGLKGRYKVYKNGIKIVDTSKTDTSSPYSISKSGSEDSTTYSNDWQLTVMSYYKTGSDTSYTYDGSNTSYDNN